MATLSLITPALVDTIIPTTVLEAPIRLGSYQIAVLRGSQSWSGADLAGKAKSYGAHYARSRKAALAKVRRAVNPFGLDLVVETRRHGRLVLAWRVAGMTIGQWERAAERPGLAGMVAF